MKLKTKLKMWRKVNNFVQKEAADILGVSLRTYQGWEIGRGGSNPLVRAELERRMHKPEDRGDVELESP